MELRYGKEFENKTLLYLLPSLLDGLGKIFQLKIEGITIMACGISDRSIENNPRFQEVLKKRAFYLLLDTFSNKRKAEDFQYWIKYQDYFLASYFQDLSSRAFMVVLEFPEVYGKAFDNFSLGKYSEMYSKEEIEKLFKKDSEQYKVLTKDKQSLSEFTEKIRKTFEIPELEESQVEHLEYEFPFQTNLEQEVFNY